MLQLIITSIITFASTNVDDIFVLSMFYGNKQSRHSNIIIGQYLGITALIGISLAASLLGFVVPRAYIGLLGLIPLTIGIIGILKLGEIKSADPLNAPDLKEEKNVAPGSIWVVAAVTFANGGDNIGIYTPLFAVHTIAENLLIIAVFLGMTFAWCMLGKYLTRHPLVSQKIEKYGHIVVPVVLSIIGVIVIYEAGTFRLLSDVIFE